MPGAEEGVSRLAMEVASWWRDKKTTSSSSSSSSSPAKAGRRSLAVVLPSGTGTTALYLARHLHQQQQQQAAAAADDGGGGICVYAIPCCGDRAYLLQQVRKKGESGRKETLLKGEKWMAKYVSRRKLHELDLKIRRDDRRLSFPSRPASTFSKTRKHTDDEVG